MFPPNLLELGLCKTLQPTEPLRSLMHVTKETTKTCPQGNVSSSPQYQLLMQQTGSRPWQAVGMATCVRCACTCVLSVRTIWFSCVRTIIYAICKKQTDEKCFFRACVPGYALYRSVFHVNSVFLHILCTDRLQNK